jgi:hypothetical protein
MQLGSVQPGPRDLDEHTTLVRRRMGNWRIVSASGGLARRRSSPAWCQPSDGPTPSRVLPTRRTPRWQR